MNTFTLNNELNGIEIRFDAKPDIETRGTLKANGFRWSRNKGIWYAKQSDERIELAKSIVNGEAVTADELVTGGEVSDGYMGAVRWDGYKSKRHLFGADLSKAIRQDIKAHGIKGATVKVHSYSMGQSITVTVKVKDSDFIPFEEWKAKQSIYDFAEWNWIRKPDGNDIRPDAWDTLSGAEKKEVFDWNAERCYTAEKNTSSAEYTDRYTTFTDELRAKIELINKIILTYRYDDSNGMVDYFDTNFYYSIVFKPVEA